MNTKDEKLIDHDASDDSPESYEAPAVVESARFETVASAQPYGPPGSLNECP